MSKKVSDIIYFDNNATTMPCQPAKDAFVKWLSCYNPSSDSKVAKPAKEMMNKVSNFILSHCKVNSATHKIIFTSGATESNCFIIRACIKAYKNKIADKGHQFLPHLIISATEHHSIMDCIEDLENNGEVEVTKITPTVFGNILPDDVAKAIKFNTCLISIMYANNEVPIINNIKLIGDIAHKNKIPLHSDCVQVFGKFQINMATNNIDALSASCHKFYGPKGVGILIINNDLIEGYNLKAEINGSQQYGLRGGTENVAGIASAMVSLCYAFKDRKKKNKHLLELREYCLEKLKNKFKFVNALNYLDDKRSAVKKETLELLSLGPPDDKKEFILPNTILLAICKNEGEPLCNVELKKFLDSKNCVIGIGSACLTKTDKASHVLYAIGAPPVVRRGVIRISFSDNNKFYEIDKFVNALEQGIIKQCKDIEIPKVIKEKVEKINTKELTLKPSKPIILNKGNQKDNEKDNQKK